MNLALAEFARDVNPEAKKQIVLLVDRAGFHTSKAVRVPAGIELFYLPPYSPELQPAERLWPLLREVIANRVLQTLSSLEKVLVNRCQWFSKNCRAIQLSVFIPMSLSACSGCAAKYRSAYAISVYPEVRNKLITALRNAHITCGMLPHRT